MEYTFLVFRCGEDYEYDVFTMNFDSHNDLTKFIDKLKDNVVLNFYPSVKMDKTIYLVLQ